MAAIFLGDWSRPEANTAPQSKPLSFDSSDFRELHGITLRIQGRDIVDDVIMKDWDRMDGAVGTEQIFPEPDVDPVYRELLDLKERARLSGISTGYEWIG